MRRNIWFFLFAIGVASAGWMAGRWARPQGVQTQEWASEASASTSLNLYENLPCPKEEDFLQMAAEVHLAPLEGSSLDLKCDDSQRAKMAKILLLMKGLQFQLPTHWPEPMRSNIQSPFDFLKTHVSKLALDLTQKTSIAYNKTAVREIYLGGRAFTSDPLEFTSVLVHEARHSNSADPGHVMCSGGDLPYTAGGCDRIFGMEDKTAGAYSYGVLFSTALALYSNGLSEGDRQYALSEAILELGARLNELPPALAKKVDLLAVLSESKEIFLVHPFLNYVQALDLKFASPDEKPERIEFSPLGNGLVIFTNKKTVWNWNRAKKLEPFYEARLFRDMQVEEVARVRVPYTSGAIMGDPILFVLQPPDGFLKYVDYIPEKNRREALDYPVLDRQAGGLKPFMHRLFLAFGLDSVYLSREGQIFFGPRYGDEPSFILQPQLQNSAGWVSGTGGLLYESLFLLNRLGELHNVKLSFEVPLEDGMADTRIYTLEKSEIVASAGWRKFAQGLQVQMTLNENGELQVWQYGNTTSKKLDLNMPVRDFVIMHSLETNEAFAQLSAPLKKFETTCQISKAVNDPWLNRGIGYDSRGELIMAGEDGSCVRSKYSDLKNVTPYYN